MQDSSDHSPGDQDRLSSKNLRLFGLLGLLAFMLGALWYDYLVARPAVVAAYGQIAALNSRFNKLPGKAFMSNLDVQRTLQRTPIQTFSEGGYFIEVYGWRSGLPIKMHYYYAVYSSGSTKMFLKHYMNGIDMAELRSFPLDYRLPAPGPVASTLDNLNSSGDSAATGLDQDST